MPTQNTAEKQGYIGKTKLDNNAKKFYQLYTKMCFRRTGEKWKETNRVQ